MQKFAALVTFLRTGWRAFYIGAPLAVAWYFVTPYCTLWFWTDHFYLIWEFKHRVAIAEITQHVAQGLLIVLGFGALCAVLMFLVWVLYTRRLDLEFTKSSVAALALGCFMFGLAPAATPYLSVPSIIPMICGAALVLLETNRMRVLANTY